MTATANTELTWEQHRDQLNRQLAWQAVRNEFYSQMCWQDKNTAAHNRAYGDMSPESSATAIGKLRNLDEMNENCMSANQFYHRVVCEIDRKIKQAQRDGDAAAHARLLDEANGVISCMAGYTTYGCYDKI